MLKHIRLYLIISSFLSSCNLHVPLYPPTDEILHTSEAKRRPSRMNQEPLKMLVLGNSWSENATDDFGLILQSLGYKIDLNRTYLSNASLRYYSNNLVTCDSILVFSTWLNNEWVNHHCKLNLKDVLKMKDWDVITVQQRSRSSISYSTYQPYLNKLLNEVYRQDIVPLVYYHVTWSYPQYIESDRFPIESMNTHSMYDAILAAWSTACKETKNNNVILSAPVIQQSRAIDGIGVDLFDTEDGLHLLQGKYAAACAWASTFINTYYDPSVRDKDIMECTFYGPYTEEIAKSIQFIAYEVTSNIEGYIEFEGL